VSGLAGKMITTLALFSIADDAVWVIQQEPDSLEHQYI
jgi:hypothetical protein